MSGFKNILFIMCDQLRQDYLSCYGHPIIQTPNIDKLASRGVTFTNAFCQAPLCGPSRASFYTGRYMSSHGVMGNEDYTRFDEWMISDHLRSLNYRTAVVGKTHNHKNPEELIRMGLSMNKDRVNTLPCGGFEPYEWHEGLYPDQILPENQGYTEYLKSKRYPTPNPWQYCANSGIDEQGNLHSGWNLSSSSYPANIREADSETAFCTDRAIEFIQSTKDRPWCLHLSYIKPHWPVIAPAPYHNRYSAKDVPAARKHESEKANPHPVQQAFMREEYSASYANDALRKLVIPAYMGLVEQLDDHLGKLFEFLETENLIDSTLIAFTSDHGDYLGDHWLGEKDLFHDPSIKIPMIVVNPDASADPTRGQIREEFIESIDLLPTFIDFAATAPAPERLDGMSLNRILSSPRPIADWRSFTICELDYSERIQHHFSDISPYELRATVVRTEKWKYVHHEAFKCQLFDLENDPDEFHDLGTDTDYQNIRKQMVGYLLKWRQSVKKRSGIDYQYLQGQGPERDESFGIIIGRK
jgi:arylsulfatase A-like enzyme